MAHDRRKPPPKKAAAPSPRTAKADAGKAPKRRASEPERPYAEPEPPPAPSPPPPAKAPSAAPPPPAREELSAREPTSLLSRKSMGAGRVGAYAALGALAGVVPLPLLPDVGSKRVRGALAFDLAARHGLSLSNEARKVFEEPWSSTLPRSVVAQAARFFMGRVLSRLGPLGFFSPIRAGLTVFLFGLLLERYLETARVERAIRIDAEEARKVRKAMDRALLLVFTVKNEGSPWGFSPRPPEDLRTSAMQLADGVLFAAAGIPEWLLARIEAAFDEALASVDG